ETEMHIKANFTISSTGVPVRWLSWAGAAVLTASLGACSSDSLAKRAGRLQQADSATIEDPSLEQQTEPNASPPPAPSVGEGPAPAARDANTGGGCNSHCGFVYSGGGDGWSDIVQTIAVTSGTTYTLSAWLQTSDPFPGGYLGVRTTDGAVLARQSYGTLDDY